MKIIFLAALLLNFALTTRGWSADQALPARPSFAGMKLDEMGYPTNAATAYAYGQADARRDLSNGVVAVKSAGSPVPWAGEFDNVLEKRYHIHTDWLAGCMVTEGLIKYIKGYNQVADAYIQQKYGTNIFEEVENEVQTKRNGLPIGALSPSPKPPGTYTVRAGDTLTKIAHHEGVTLKQLLEANPNVVPTRLKIGQQIVVSPDKTNRVPKALPAAN